MCYGKLLFVWPLLLFFLVSALGAEQQYRITESQLQNIEKSLERLEQDRQSWQLQAHELKNEAETLNGQLQTERGQYKTLQTSFNKLEASRLTELAELNQQKQKAEDKAERYKKQRLTLFFIGTGIGVALLIIGRLCLRFFLKR